MSREPFAATWVLTGRAEEVPSAGSYYTWDRTQVPLLVLRSTDGEIRAFYNSCRHRGAPVVRDACGRNRAFRCQYHSWTYDTLGRLKSVPDERDFVDLCREERSLVAVRAEVAGGWIFLNEDATARGLADTLAPLQAELRGVPAFGDSARLAARSVTTVDAGWATALDALAGLFAAVDPAARTVTLNPNVLVPVGGSALPLVAVWPVDDRTSHVEVLHTSVDGETPDGDAMAPFADRVAAVLRARLPVRA